MNRQATKPMQVMHRTLALLGTLLCAYALFLAMGVLIPPLAVAQPVAQSQIDTAGDANMADRRASNNTSSKENQTDNHEPAPLNPIKDDKQGNQGCCSYHGGICGKTQEGELLCCDGAISPTCDL